MGRVAKKEEEKEVKKEVKTEKVKRPTIDKTVFIDSFVASCIIMIIVYSAMGPFNSETVEFLQDVAKAGNAFKMCLIMLPMVYVVYLLIRLTTIVVKEEEKNK